MLEISHQAVKYLIRVRTNFLGINFQAMPNSGLMIKRPGKKSRPVKAFNSKPSSDKGLHVNIPASYFLKKMHFSISYSANN